MLHTPRAGPDVVVGPSGSYLGCLTANRWFGHGWRMDTRDHRMSVMRTKRLQLKRARWDRRRSARIHRRRSLQGKARINRCDPGTVTVRGPGRRGSVTTPPTRPPATRPDLLGRVADWHAMSSTSRCRAVLASSAALPALGVCFFVEWVGSRIVGRMRNVAGIENGVVRRGGRSTGIDSRGAADLRFRRSGPAGELAKTP